jgi:hypothetical protein
MVNEARCNMQNRNVAACSVGFVMRDGFFNQFSKILLRFLQRRNQFCPIKQKAKESLVQLFSFELSRYYNYNYYTRYSVTKHRRRRRRHPASSYQDIIKNTIICEKAPDAAHHHISNRQER